MNYLMIENAGEAPIAGLTLLGATTKDPSVDDSTIGMFGSGTKYSVLALLRGNIYPIITTGRDRLEWRLIPRRIGSVQHSEVLVAINNKKPVSTGMVLKAGESDWKQEVQLALREFVSNALDAVGKDQVRYQLVDEPRARSGYTRVFIPWSDLKVFEDFLHKYFLHWNPNTTPNKSGAITKQPSGLTDGRPKFYRRGVLIRSWSTAKPSLWDYNFTDLNLDEARNSNDWNLQYEAAKLLSKDKEKLRITINRISKDPTLWEAELNQYGLDLSEMDFGNVVFADSQAAARIAERKGMTTLVLPQNWISAIDSAGGPTVHKQLGEWIQKGVDLLDDKDVRHEILTRVLHWQVKINEAGLASETFPKVKAFSQHPGAEKKLYGFATSSGIFINHELGGELLDQTIIEELAHYHSGSHDFTREFQEWLIRFLLRTIQ